MASWVFCNRCFQPPRQTACFSLTNCGHVYCEGCLGKGKKDECVICKVPCRTVLLSKHTDSDIQALFMGIDGLCKKYSKETSQISEFQEKHRKRLLTFYREKISKLEDSLRKSVLRIQELQSMRSSQQTVFSTIRNSVSTPSAQPHGCPFLPPDSSASERVESMEVDLTPSPLRKPEIAAGPTRISLISPPQDGRMGGQQHVSDWQLLEPLHPPSPHRHPGSGWRVPATLLSCALGLEHPPCLSWGRPHVGVRGARMRTRVLT
ncbi:probable E3 SUMO-protein ligase RNF212 isoform X4 [Equus przewalskii]|uniref:Probable E3 SUMO-protein ligase RNF212 isoform X4 n=1 Tax=Equus przewalskii TaxID=9798 RepID=A0ABM4NXC5_EQUPR